VVPICVIRAAAAGVTISLPFTINPPSTNFQIVCRRKDRGGCGCSCQWSWCFGFCLFGGRPSRGHCVYSIGGNGGGVTLRGGSWYFWTRSWYHNSLWTGAI